MKRLTKLTTLVVVALVASLTMVSAAWAATITINQNNDEGAAGAETYNMYKIFDVTKTGSVTDPVTTDDTIGPAGEDSTGFAYTISTESDWFDVLGSVSEDGWTAVEGQSWVTLTKSAGNDAIYNVEWAGDNTEDAAKAFAKWLKDNMGEIDADATMESSDGVAVKEEVADGYWLIDSSLGTSLVLATSDITIETKNQYVTDSKEVAKTNYSVGDTVTYTIDVNLPATIDYTKLVTVHDTMDSALALDAESVSAKIGNTAFNGITLVESDDFGDDHSASHAAANGKTLFDFVLDISSLAPGEDEDAEAITITITYDAELTSDAAVNTDLVNEEFTEYSKYTTAPNDATIQTYDFQLVKTFDGEANEDLEATFVLADADGNQISFISDDTGYVKVDSDDGTGSTTLTVPGTEKGINVRGLAAGTYTLTETGTADGYNMLETATSVEVTAGGTEVEGYTPVTVDNQSGSVLPSTGGMGTTILYVIGAILVIGAGVFLVARRRARRELDEQ